MIRRVAFALTIACSSGCFTMQHQDSVQTKKINFSEHANFTQSDQLQQNKLRVHIYFIHGLDPLDLANLRSVEQYCKDLGFNNTVYVTLHQGAEVVDHIRCTKELDPNARILVYGYSAGADVASRTVNRLHDCFDVNVDVLFYVSGITLMDTEASRPGYVGKILHIRDGGRLIPGMELTGAENHRFSDVWHFGTPMHPDSLALLKRELLDQEAKVLSSGSSVQP